MRDKRGFSLIEVMLAMLIMLVSTLGVYAMIAISTGSNAQNEARDQAVRYAEEVVNRVRNLPYNALEATPRWQDPGHNGWNDIQILNKLNFGLVDIPDPEGGPPLTMSGTERIVRKRAIPYGLEINVVWHPVGVPFPSMKDIQVRVTWTYAAKRLSHTVGTIVKDPDV